MVAESHSRCNIITHTMAACKVYIHTIEDYGPVSPALAFSLMSTIFLMRTRNSCETWVRYSDSLSSKVSTVTASGHRACMMLPDWGKMDRGTDMCQITTIILQNLEVVTIATMTTVLLPWLQCCYHGCSVGTMTTVLLPRLQYHYHGATVLLLCYLAKQGPDLLTDVGADGTQEESLHLRR